MRKTDTETILAPMPARAGHAARELERAEDHRTMPHELAERHRATRTKLGPRAAGIPPRMPQIVRA